MKKRIICLLCEGIASILSSTVLAEEVCKPLADSELSAHMLYIDAHGRLHSPLTHNVVTNEAGYVEHMLLKASQSKSITIFIHGGLNRWKTAIARPRELARCIMEDGTYPIFIGWSSNPVGNYWDHLIRLRRGKSQPLWLGLPSAPFVLLEDIARSIVRTLPALYKEVNDPLDIERMRSRPELTGAMLDADRQQLQRLVEGAKSKIPGVTLLTSGEGVPESYMTAVNPAKLISAPLVDGIGTGIWASLLRRTDFVLDRSEDYETNAPIDPADPQHADTAATYLLKRLTEQQAQQKGPDTINLIGHSMGTFVATNILARHPDLEFSNIVFLAAAAPLKSLESVVAPWLAKHNESHFYNLTLDPDLEISDRVFYDFAPRGSLLNWIDGIFASVNSFKDRSAGSWSNISQAADEIFAAGCEIKNVKKNAICVKERVHLTRFGVGNDRGPQKHGEFDEYFFWRPEFWAPKEGISIKMVRGTPHNR